MTVGIYTIHAETNYGAMLQAFATQAFLRRNGIVAEIVNLFTKEDQDRMQYKLPLNSAKNVAKNFIAIIHPQIRKKIERLQEFHSSMSLSKRYYFFDEIYRTPPTYDIHLVGSDQVWNLQKGFNKRNFFFLDFLHDNQCKMSYGSSLGNPNISWDLYPKLKELLFSFKAISTREAAGVTVLKAVTGKDVAHVVDPTFLLSSDEWMQQTIPDPLIKGDYILYYGFDKSERCKQMIKTLKEELKIPVVAVSANITIPYHVDKFCRDAGPREFLNLFRYASYVITSSFHGMAFAINFRRNFFVMSHGDRMSRMESLLSSFNIHNRIVGNKEDLLKSYRLQPIIDYSESESFIETQIKKSSDWLLSQLQ